MSMDEMIAKFEIKDIHKAGAVLDPIKLDWMNGEYIKKMPLGELHSRLNNYLEKYEADFYKNTYSQVAYEFNEKIITELQTRMKRFDEYRELTAFLYAEPKLAPELFANPKMKIESEDGGREALAFLLPLLETADYSSLDAFKEPILNAIANVGKKNGQILWPLRVALSGEQYSPGAFELAYILGRDETLRRVRQYL